MSRLSFAPFVVAAMLLASANARGQTVDARLAERIPALLKQHKVEGAAVATIEEGNVVWARGFGWANVKRKIVVTSQTRFNVGSISKPVTAVEVLRLARQGRVDLDAPAERYLKGWRFPESAFDRHDVTLRRILSHTAGLSVAGVWAFQPGESLPPLRATLSRDSPYAEEVDHLWDGKGGVRIILRPGSMWRYSGGGYALAQLAIENVTDEDFATYMRRTMFRRLGMNASTFVQSAQPDLRLLAQPYSKDGEEVPFLRFNASSAAGLISNADDLGRFVAHVLVADAKHFGGMLQPQPGSAPNPWGNDGWGLGFPLERLPNGSHLAFHFGGNEGFVGVIAGIRDARSGIVVLTNSSNGLAFCLDVLCRWLSTQTTGHPDLCKDVSTT